MMRPVSVTIIAHQLYLIPLLEKVVNQARFLFPFVIPGLCRCRRCQQVQPTPLRHHHTTCFRRSRFACISPLDISPHISLVLTHMVLGWDSLTS